MLLRFSSLGEIKFPELMAVYEEGNRENAADRYPEDIRTQYESYIKDNMEFLARRIIDEQLTDALQYLTAHQAIGKTEYPRILEYAQQKKTMEIVALLLEYRGQREDIDAFDKYAL